MAIGPARLTGGSGHRLAHEGHQVGLLLLVELEPQDQVEELDGVLQREARPSCR